MKEFELTLKLRNNLLKSRRLELGLKSRELAEKAGVAYVVYLQLEAMTRSPRVSGRPGRKGRHPGEWTASASKVAEFFGASCEELWPDAVLKVKNPTQVREVSAEQALALAKMAVPLELPPTPLELIENREAESIVREALDSSGLSGRERFVLDKRFGLLDENDMTLEETGVELDGLSRERVRHIELAAIRKLRDRLQHPDKARRSHVTERDGMFRPSPRWLARSGRGL